MYAVFATGGKQYRAAPGDVLKVEKLDAAPGEVVELDQVMLVADGDNIAVGAPLVAGAMQRKRPGSSKRGSCRRSRKTWPMSGVDSMRNSYTPYFASIGPPWVCGSSPYRVAMQILRQVGQRCRRPLRMNRRRTRLQFVH